MQEVQHKAKLSKQPKAFESNKTLLVQTHEHFQTCRTGQNKIVWECTEGNSALLEQWPHDHMRLRSI